MILYNLKQPKQEVNFAQAVRQGLGDNQGLFFPKYIPKLNNIVQLLQLPLIERSQKIVAALIGDELPSDKLNRMIANAFTFPVPVVQVSEDIYALELFHGPTLAFKDFGARFMAQTLSAISNDGDKITILTATSGDTGAAVAHAFYGLENVKVVILYPQGKISALQEKLFCTIGGNIQTIAIKGDFDDCQALVKQAFEDSTLRQKIGLNSANSINISRLLAQVCYYFEAVAQLPSDKRIDLVVSVPSGNFGNLTAGLIAKVLGLPIKRFIAATNANDTVPRYLQTGEWDPKTTVATLSNAMDVSRPNNWPRVEKLLLDSHWGLASLGSKAVNDAETEQTLMQMYAENYLSEPHSAIAYRALKEDLKQDETGLFLCTAHPAKFKESVERILSIDLSLPETLAKHNKLPLLSKVMENDFILLRDYLLTV